MSRGEEEKLLIEKASAESFINLYNQMMGATFKIVDMKDAPDARCKDAAGTVFNFEITMTEDSKGGIAAALGGADHKSIKAVRLHLRGDGAVVNCLQGNVLENLKVKIEAKSLKDYGSNCGLLVRDTSGVLWDWKLVINDKFRNDLSNFVKPYPKGIWLLSFDKKTIYCLHPGEADVKDVVFTSKA